MYILLIFILCLSIAPACKSLKAKQAQEEARRIQQNKEQAKQAAIAYRARQAEEKHLARIQRENERRQAQEEKRRQQKEQAAQDLPFYEVQLERLYPTAESLRHQYKLAIESVNHDSEMNQHGAVIKDKVVNEHITQRDRLLKKLTIAENQIHALEKKIHAAQAILSN